MWPLVPHRLSPIVRAVGLALVALVLATFTFWPMIESGRTPEGDGRHFFHQIEVAKVALRDHHELPLWNAFDCRGIPMWDHPESITASPLLLLSTPLGGTATMWIWNIAHCAAGFVSMWLLARREIGLSATSAFVAACMWAFSVAHVSQYAGAHSTLIDFWLLPLLILLFRRAEHDLRAAVGLGVVLAFMVYEGATYPLPFVTLILALEACTRVWPPRRLLRVVRAGGVAAIVGVGLSAARLFPLLDQLVHTPRKPYVDVDQLARAYTLKQMFLFREGHWFMRISDQQYVWGEYVAYVGHLALLLALVGLLLSLRDLRWLAFLGAATFALMLGHFARFAPWTLLHTEVFPFTAMRVPSRFRLVFQMFLALWVALAVERAPRLLERFVGTRSEPVGRLRALVVGCALLAAGDAMGLSKDIVEWMHLGAPETVVDAAPRFHFEGAGLADIIDQPRQNRAWLGCRSYEWPSNAEAPVWTGDVRQARAATEEVAVLAVERTPNTFVLEVEAKANGRVILNSGYARGWIADVGTVVEHDPQPGVPSVSNKMLAVDVPAGHHCIELRYRPRFLAIGAWVSLASAVLVAVFFAAPVVVRRVRR